MSVRGVWPSVERQGGDLHARWLILRVIRHFQRSHQMAVSFEEYSIWRVVYVFAEFYMALANFPTFWGALHEASRRLVLRPITQFERRRVRLLGPDAMQLLNSSRLAEWGLVRLHRRYHFWTPFLRKGFADGILYGLHLSSRKTSETGHTNQWAGAGSVHTYHRIHKS